MAKYLVSGTAVIRVDNSTGTILVLGTAIDSISDNVGKEVAALDVTSFADSAERFIAGIEMSKQITIEGPYEDSGSAAPDNHYSTLVGTIQTVEFNPAGTVAGRRKITGEFLCLSYNVIMVGKQAVRWRGVHQLDNTLNTTGTT